jgi:hypothetical protein
MHRSLRIFLACALGGGIGSFSALQFAPWLGWLGLIVGGFTGYISYDFREIIRAIPIAWRLTVGFRPTQFQKYFVLFMLSMASNLFFFATVGMMIDSRKMIPAQWDIKSSLGFLLLYSFITLFAAVFKAASMNFKFIEGEEETSDIPAENLRLMKFLACYMSPLAALFYWPVRAAYWTFKKIWEVVLRTPRIALTAYAFAKTVLVITHSEIRLLCLLDSAVGAAIGWYFSNALIGAFAGGIFGVLNYEIFSKRVFKLVPFGK